MKSLIQIITFNLLSLSLFAQWDYTDVKQKMPAGDDVKFSLYLPKNTDTIKAVFMISRRSDLSEKFAKTSHLRTLADKYGFAITLHFGASDYTHGFSNLANGDSLLAGVAKLANESGRPELAHVPVVPFGHSLGIYYSRGLGYWSAGKKDAGGKEYVGGVISFKLSKADKSRWSWLAAGQESKFLNIPHMMINGEIEGPDTFVGTTAYLAASARTDALGFRSNGGLTHQIVDINGGHNTMDTSMMNMIGLFIGKVIQYRVPKGHNLKTSRPDLNVIPESSGWLGSSTKYNDFDEADYSIGAFGSQTASTSFWFFDEEYAKAWKSYQVHPLSISISSGSFCPGDKVTINYTLNGSGTFNADNYMQVQISNPRSDFDAFTYPLRVIGYKQTSDKSGSVICEIPENIIENFEVNQTDFQISQAGGSLYRIRMFSSSPIMQSNNTGEITIADAGCTNPDWFPFINRFEMLMVNGVGWENNRLRNLVLPFEDGQEFAYPSRVTSDTVRVVKLYSKQTMSFNTGNVFTAQLSDKNGSFISPISVGTLSGALSGSPKEGYLGGQELTITIPQSQLEPGQYSLRVVSSDPADTSSLLGHKIFIRDMSLVTSVDEADLTTGGSKESYLYPNPFDDILHISINEVKSVKLFNSSGTLVSNLKVISNNINTSSLPKGIYIALIHTESGVTVEKLIKR